MNWLVDTSVWSLALRRDTPVPVPAVEVLRKALEGEELQVFTTGLILQELLQGFSGPKAREQLLKHFSAMPFVQPELDDHVEAAGIRNACRQRGVQIGTVDALLIQLSRKHELVLLSTDKDFLFAQRHVDFPLWTESSQSSSF